ncbi:hypothetical protein I5693_15745 [Burkholderia cenocepacia]|uniref:hypothetical protein n=1 Tax=Burkholderia cepacia complex TaxID=87882 RepID=UPI00158C56D8|nr:hypothetical protein [Burkholderia cenocepacia]MBJ9669001.1 hypothetical protein [Burkholderia cenocepacia]
MTEHPILFNEPMSAAVRAGRKSQTRRVMTPQPFFDDRGLLWWHWSKHAGSAWDQPIGAPSEAWLARCPYGVPGERLWVRETHIAYGRWETRFSEKKGRDEWHFIDMTLETGREYRFDGAVSNAARGGVLPAWWRRPSIFMPRAAARTLLEVTGVRVERLQTIEWDEAIAEGISDPRRAARRVDPVDGTVAQFRQLWDGLNAARGHGWDTNPWVWVVAFRRIEP